MCSFTVATSYEMNILPAGHETLELNEYADEQTGPIYTWNYYSVELTEEEPYFITTLSFGKL